MIKFTTTSGVKLRTLFETISPLLVEGTIEISATTKDDVKVKEFRVRGVNNISFCDARIYGSEDDISEFHYDWPEPSISIGVSFETIHSCLSAVSPNDSVTFFISQENQNCARPHITISIENEEVGYSYEDNVFLLMLESPEMQEFDKLDDNFDAVVSMSSTLLLRVLRNSAKRSESVQIYTRKVNNINKIYFRSKGDDAELLFGQKFDAPDSKKMVECLKKDVSSLKYLLIITKATNLSSTVRLYLKDQTYLCIQYNLGTRSSVLFCLAAQIERVEDCPLTRLEQLALSKLDKPKDEGGLKISKYRRPVKRKRNKKVSAKEASPKKAK
jgi:hypothetical protein